MWGKSSLLSSRWLKESYLDSPAAHQQSSSQGWTNYYLISTSWDEKRRWKQRKSNIFLLYQHDPMDHGRPHTKGFFNLTVRFSASGIYATCRSGAGAAGAESNQHNLFGIIEKSTRCAMRTQMADSPMWYRAGGRVLLAGLVCA